MRRLVRPTVQRYGTSAMGRRVWLVVAFALLGSACKKKEAPPPPVPVVEAPEAAVPAPDGLMIEGIVRAPDAIMQSFRAITPLIPDRVAPILADMLHVSRETTDEVDGTKPAYFVLARKPEGNAFVLAVPVKDAGKVLTALGKQGLARTEDPSQGLSIFEAGQAATGPRGQVLGVRRNYLLAASTVAALKELTPFATRTMPTRALPKEDVAFTIPQVAMRGPVRDALNAVIQQAAARRKDLVAKNKGDAGIPRAVGALDAIGEYAARSNERLVAWLADAGDGHLTISTTQGSMSIRGDVDVVNPDSAFAKQVNSWPVGDALASLDMPAGALLAFVGRSSDSARTESSKDFSDMLSSMYPDDVGAKEKAKIDDFLAAWDKARSDLTSGALLYDGPAHLAVVFKLGAKDPAALAKLTKEALNTVLSIKGVNQGLTKEGIGAPKFSDATIAGSHVDVMSLNMPHKPGEKPKPGEPETADVVFGPVGSEVLIVAGVGSKDLFASVIDAKGAKSLHAYSSLESYVKGLGGTLAGFAVGSPSRMLPLASGAAVPQTTPPPDPIMFAIGKGAKGPYLSIDISRNAVELAGRFAMGAAMKQ
jgi:hypothetical protein